jgi:tape measure domain-containing protein
MRQTAKDGRGMYDRLDAIQDKMGRVKMVAMALASTIGNIVAEAFWRAADAAREYASTLVMAAAETEKQAIAFEVLTGSAENSAKLMKQINDLAVETPFDISELRNITKQMLAFGFSQEEVIPLTKMLGDITAGTGGDLTLLGRAIGQVRTKGKLYAQELNQLGEQGLAVREVLANQLGVSVAELMEGMDAGTITVTWEQFRKTLEGIHKDKFMDLMERQAQTFAGRLQNVQEQISLVGQEILGVNTETGEIIPGSMIDRITKGLEQIIGFLEKNKEAIIEVGQTAINFLGGAFDTAGSIMRAAFKALKGIYDLVVKGDFTKGFADSFGVFEDNPIVSSILQVRKGIKGIYDLVVKGDFTKAFGDSFGVFEDSPLVSNILKARKGIKGLFDLIAKGDFTKNFAEAFGVAEDSPVVSNILELRDTVVGAFDFIKERVRVFGDFLNDTFSDDIKSFVSQIWPTFVNAFNWFAENILPHVTNALKSLGGFFANTLQPRIQWFIDYAWTNLQNGFRFFTDVIWPLLQPILQELGDQIMNHLWPAIQELWDVIQNKWIPAFMEIWEIIGPLILPILAILAGIILVVVVAAAKILIAVLTLLIQALSWLLGKTSEVIVWLVDGWNWAVAMVGAAIGFLIGKFIEFRSRVSGVINSVKGFFQGLVNKAGQIVGSIGAKFNEIKNRIKGAFDAVRNIDLYQIGVDIIQGLINGISAKMGELAAKVSELANIVPSGIDDVMIFGSPSKLMEQFGKWTGEGLAVGMNQSRLEVASASANLAANAVAPVANTNNNINYNNTFNVSGSNANDITNQINQKLARQNKLALAGANR